MPGAEATQHRRSANLDVVRAVAALMVLLGHAAGLSRAGGGVPFVVACLSSGVALFFALSGYLIAGPFLRALLEGRRPAGRRYAIRRAARILPGY